MTDLQSFEVRLHYGFPLHKLDRDALWIVERLTRSGHLAYLVGGCIRDLLSGLPPKDFDIATSARPNQIKRLFRASRIIGRRFRLAHVWFGPKVIEVSTFRGMSQDSGGGGDEWGPIRDDNVFGAPEEDAMRRDFTINGLFYDVRSGEIIDYVGGLTDLRRRSIRTIGDSEARMIEDPVRMIRALKFAARFDFALEPALASTIRTHHHHIESSSPSRVLEELFKILSSGAASATIRLLAQYQLLDRLLPEISRRLDRDGGQAVYRYLDALDAADQGQRRHSNAVLLACLLVPLLDPLERRLAGLVPGERDSIADLALRTTRLVRGSALLRNLPRRDLYQLGQIMTLQRRLAQGEHAPAQRVVTQEEFGDTLALFRIGSEACDAGEELVSYWEQKALEFPISLDRPAHDGWGREPSPWDPEPRSRRRRRRR